MSLTMEPTTHDIEGRAEAVEQVRDQLHQHLVDMDDLRAQVRSAYEADGGQDEELQDLYAELLDALEQHHGLISEQLSELNPFGELPEHELECETATCSR